MLPSSTGKRQCLRCLALASFGNVLRNVLGTDEELSWSHLLFELMWMLLCAGVESPSHAIRADADPLARSATSVVITLADKYTYDFPVEILIYPSGMSTT